VAGRTSKKPAKVSKTPKSGAAAKAGSARRLATPSRPPRRGGKPKLLSGGNPQIAKAEGDAPVQAYIEAMPGWKRDVGRKLDRLIVRALPASRTLRKAVKWNSPFYGIDGQGWFLSLHCFTGYIKLAFFRGQSLRPVPPEASKNKEVRYFHICEGDSLDEPQLTTWIRQAAALPGWIP
jgi:hypothetical protein